MVAQRVDLALAGQDLERGQLQVVQRDHRPAVLAGRRRRSRRPCRPARSMWLQQVGDVDASLAGRLERRRARRAPPGAAAAPTGAYWRRSSSSALADQGSSSQSSTSHSVPSSSHSPAGVDAGADALEERRLERGVGEEGPAGPGVDGARRPADSMPNRAGPPTASRQTTTTARDPMCFSSHTTRSTPAARKAANASWGCSSSPSRSDVAVGDMVGGR